MEVAFTANLVFWPDFHFSDNRRLAVSSGAACSAEELERWGQWALSEADRIDPAAGGAFLAALGDEDGTRGAPGWFRNSGEMIGSSRK